MRQIVLVLFTLFFAACGSDHTNGIKSEEHVPRLVSIDAKRQGLGDYWYQGKAEISRYVLSQNRYREIHPGEAVLIFVTEDFLTDKQVKNDYYRNPNSVSILKLNAIHRFATGLYDYSVMTSVFTPVKLEQYAHSLKVTNSSQDWCGQTFMQINAGKKNFKVRWFSYFEKEADTQVDIPLGLLEDEVWTRLRVNPASLPTGEMAVMPAAAYFRLMHIDCKPYMAKAELMDYSGAEFSGKGLKTYRISYPELRRTLEIVFGQEPPYRIEGWKETFPSLSDGVERSTIGRRVNTLLTDYWKKNGTEFQALRREFMLNQ